MSRNQQVTRQLKILGFLSNRKGGITVGEISRDLNISPRTIYRDFEALQEAGIPLVNDKSEGPKTHWMFVDGYRYQVPIPFALNELMALYFSRGLLNPLKGTPFQEGLEKALIKIKSSLSDDLMSFVDRAEKVFGAGLKGNSQYKRFRDLTQLLSQAALNGETMKINYYSYSGGKTSRRVVDPYKIYYYEGTLYLIGFCHKTSEIRTFAIERINMANKTGNKFELSKVFSVEDYFKDSFGVFRQELTDVSIRFDNKVAPFVKSRFWHSSQQIKELSDGSIIMDLLLAGTREVKTWVMGFSEHVEVLKPISLREEIAEDLKKMMSHYELKYRKLADSSSNILSFVRNNPSKF